ncbi:phage tail protein [Paenibacillus ehimensis]|uniref:phage tail protein n=1 Tax=Paenibacillus ehimensis TaxID=79264 RepID=UPI00046EEC06|nr:hypothetical protein [Paenibacillus ehimensis]
MAGFQKDLNGFGKNLSASFSGLKTAIAGVAAAIATLGIASAVDDAMKVEAAMGQLQRTMGSNAKEFEQWSRTTAASYGLARSEAVRYGATYSQMISDFSKSTKETMKSTEDVLKAAATISISTGRDMVDVTDRIRSAFNQEADGADELGVNVRVAALEASEAFKKFANGRQWADLSQATQRQIILTHLLSEVSRRYGDELANNTMVRHNQFTAQLRNAKTALGEAFLPIYNAVLPALTAMATALANTASAVAQFTAALFGAQTQKQTQQTAQQAKAVSGLGDSYKKAGKDAKHSLAAFDEINELTKGSGDSGDKDAAAAAKPPEMEKFVPPEESENRFKEWAEKIREAMAPVRDAFDGLKKALGELWKALTDLWNALGGDKLLDWLIKLAAYQWAAMFDRFKGLIEILTGVVKMLQGIFTLDGGKFLEGVEDVVSGLYDLIVVGMFGAIIPGSREKLIEFKGVLAKAWHDMVAEAGPILENMKQFFLNFWQSTLVPFGSWLSTVFVAAWGVVQKVAMVFWKDVLVPLGQYLVWLWQEVITPVAAVLTDILAVGFDIVSDVAMILWKNVLVPLGDFLGTVFVTVVKGVIDILSVWWENILKPLGAFILNVFKKAIENLIDTFKFLWHDVLKPLIAFLKETLQPVFETVAEAIKGIILALKKVFVGLIEFIVGIFTADWKRAWEGFKLIVEGIWDGIVAIIKGAVNLIIDFINFLVRSWNKIELKMPAVNNPFTGEPMFGGVTISVPKIPEIPKLARGGVVTGPTVAMIGEAGAEAVLPLERGDVFDKFAGSVSTAMVTALQTLGGGTSNRGNGDIVLSIDGVAFARITNAYSTNESKRIGGSMITTMG